MKKNKKTSIHVLIADSHEIVRTGLKSIFSLQDDIEVIGETSSFEEVLLTSILNPDVILLGLNLIEGNCLERISELAGNQLGIKVLIFTASQDKEIHLLALQYGAVGILLKNQPAELICKAIHSVYSNDNLWVGHSLTTEMWHQHFNLPKLLKTESSVPCLSTLPNIHLLTHRECKVACLSSKGLSAKQIGEKLFISDKTVRNQLTIIYNKLNVKNQLDLSLHTPYLHLCHLYNPAIDCDICSFESEQC